MTTDMEIEQAFTEAWTEFEAEANDVTRKVMMKALSYIIFLSPVKTGSYVRSHRVIGGRYRSEKPTFLGQLKEGKKWGGKWARIGGPHAQKAKTIAMANELKKIKSLKYNQGAKIVNRIPWAGDVEIKWGHQVYHKAYVKAKAYMKALLAGKKFSSGVGGKVLKTPTIDMSDIPF